jgi:hypothetical protein
VRTTDDGSRLTDKERKLELKARCKRQVAQCEASLDPGARSEWFGLRVTSGDDDNSGDKTAG